MQPKGIEKYRKQIKIEKWTEKKGIREKTEKRK